MSPGWYCVCPVCGLRFFLDEYWIFAAVLFALMWGAGAK